MKRLVIIDGKSVFYRGYYAMGALSTSDGTPTGGVYGFAAIAMEIVRKLDPTKVVVAWDSKTSTAQRKKVYDQYKAGRTKPGEDFYAQIPLLEELVKALGWSFVECEGYEADDIIGTLSLQAGSFSERSTALKTASAQSTHDKCASFRSNATNVATSRASSRKNKQVSSSLDSYDWTSSPCSSSPMTSSQKDSSELTSSAERSNALKTAGAPSKNMSLEESYSEDDEGWETYIVSSDLDMLQIVDENTRMYRILKGFSQLEELDVAAVEAKYGIKKVQFLDLKALKGDASDNIPGVPGIGEKTAVKLLNQYGTLDGIYEHLNEITGMTRNKLEEGQESARMSYFLAKIMTDAPVKLRDLPDLVIDDDKIIKALQKLEFKSLIAKFRKAREFGGGTRKAAKKADTRKGETESLSKTKGKAAGAKSHTKNVVENAGAWQQTLEIPHETPDGKLLSWNIKDLMHKNVKVAEEILAGKPFWDLAQGAFLLNPLAREVTFGDELAEYERQKAEFAEKSGLYKIFMQFDLPLIPVLYQMEKVGMLIDRQYFKNLKAEFAAEVGSLEEQIWQLAGRQFNINSPLQLSEVLFNDLALPTRGIKKTARGYSTGVKELDKLQDKHPIIAKIREYREAAKLLSTYIEPLPELADVAGRVHTTFNQNVTATGRLSSTNPNLQNIPVRTEVGRRIRTGFVAGEDMMLVSADYSQFELRLAAVLARDQVLIDDFNNNVDIHTKTAAEAFGVPMENVTKLQRRAAKVINFGILYGMSVRGLADAADMSYDEAKQFIDNYFELRKPIKEYLDKILVQAREKGYVETFFGRRRPTPDVLSSNFIVRTGAERAAQNMPIQGTEADLMKRAMINVQRKLEEEFGKKDVVQSEVRMVMQVHDSLIIECAENLTEKVSVILKEEMENVAPELPIKLAVDVTVGENWGEL